MAKRLAVALTAVLLMAMASAAQKPNQQSTADSPALSERIATISGFVGKDGTTLTTDNGKTVFAVANPESLLDTVGEQVSLRPRIDDRRHELIVDTVRIDPRVGAHLHDAAFRR
jgi:hypothetical protein